MISQKRGSTLVNFSKNLVADQTWKDLTLRYNTNCAFNVTEGLGSTLQVTTAVVVNVGGFADQRVTATMKYVAPTTTANHDLGVGFRYRNLDGLPNYYYARCRNQKASIYKIVDNVWSLLVEAPFALPPDVSVTIVAEAIDDYIHATFSAPGVATVDINSTDAAHAMGGAAFWSISQTIWCSSIAVEQLR